MSEVFSVLKSFVLYITTFADLIWELFKSIITLLGFAGQFLILVAHILPMWIEAPIIILIGVSIVYKVTGREGNA